MASNKIYGMIGGAVAVGLLLLSLQLFSESDPSAVDPAEEEERLSVLASFFPYYEFTKNVAGSSADVKQFIPTAVEAHDWEPAASEIQLLDSADVFVYGGLGVESYLDRIIGSEDYSDTFFLNVTDGLSFVPLRVSSDPHEVNVLHEIEVVLEELDEGHITPDLAVSSIDRIVVGHEDEDEEHVGHEDEDEEHVGHEDEDEEHVGDEDEHAHAHGGILEQIETILHEIEDGHMDAISGLEEIRSMSTDGVVDPHIWLDPFLVKMQVERIRDGLAQADPANADMYAQNAASYSAELDALDARIKAALTSCKGDTIVPFHNAFAYFGDRYDINIAAIGGQAPEAEASASEIAEFVDFVRENDINVIFAEDLVDPRLAEVIAEEAGAEVMLLSPLEGLTAEEVTAGASYISKMEDNLDAITIALECS